MDRHLTRRDAIKATAGTLAIASGANLAQGEQEPPTDASIDEDPDAAYPRCVYQLNDAGEWEVALPINIHARVPGQRSAAAVVEDAFTRLSNIQWTRVFPDARARAWDPTEEALVGPVHSFRRPRLGDEWAHVHVWAVGTDRAAIHAHLDVVDLTASHLHRGDQYGDAAQTVTEQLRDSGWREHTPYSIDYGVTDEQRERWGETGDVKVEWTESA